MPAPTPRLLPLSLFTLTLLGACGDSDATGESSGSSSSSGTTTSGTDSSSSSAAPGDSTAGSASGSATGSSSSGGSSDPDTSSGSSGPAESSSSSTGEAVINGCADGEREAFEDEMMFPDIAGCAGGFSVPGVYPGTTMCDREAGDDGTNPTGRGCTVEDLCSEGWHLCESDDEVSAAGVDDCNNFTFGGGFFATAQSGNGKDTCSAVGTNDVFGCGDIGFTMISACAPLNRSTANLCTELPEPWSCDVSVSEEAQFLTKAGPEFGGVLCCLDAA